MDFADKNPESLELHKFGIAEISSRLYLSEQETREKLLSEGYKIKDCYAYKIIRKKVDTSKLAFEFIDFGIKPTVKCMIANNMVKDGNFKVKLENYKQREEFLMRALQMQNCAYGLVTCKSKKGGFATVTVNFSIVKRRPPREGYGYIADPVELLSWELDAKTNIRTPDDRIKAITYEEAAKTFSGYYIRNNRVYETDAWPGGDVLPDEIEDIRIISAEECVDWMIENSPVRTQ